MEKFFHDNRVDHVAIAVADIEAAVFLYEKIFGFELLNRREITGEFSGMLSAELDAGGYKVVLLQGTCPESQISQYVKKYGPGVQHIAISVTNIEKMSNNLKASGVVFATDIIRGDGLLQIFTKRDENSGMMFEFIERQKDTEGFQEGNIKRLFQQLEVSKNY